MRKRTVEECWSISVHDLLRGGWLDMSFEQLGQIVWRRGGRDHFRQGGHGQVG